MAEVQMPPHVQAAYKDAVDNIIFHNRQEWVATNYALLIYAAISTWREERLCGRQAAAQQPP